jgi:nucleotide-binding universal stress UspA family protein
MFKHILCPTDVKDRSDMALKKAVQIAHQFGSKITLLNVHEEFMDREERSFVRPHTRGLGKNGRWCRR